MKINSNDASWLSYLALIQSDSLSNEYEDVYNDFFSHSIDHEQDFDLYGSNDSTEIEDEKDSIDESDEESIASDTETKTDLFKFSENDFVNVSTLVRLFFTETCKRLFYKNHACCFYFKPIEIEEMRDSCAFRDHWQNGICSVFGSCNIGCQLTTNSSLVIILIFVSCELT